MRCLPVHNPVSEEHYLEIKCFSVDKYQLILHEYGITKVHFLIIHSSTSYEQYHGPKAIHTFD